MRRCADIYTPGTGTTLSLKSAAALATAMSWCWNKPKEAALIICINEDCRRSNEETLEAFAVYHNFLVIWPIPHHCIFPNGSEIIFRIPK